MLALYRFWEERGVHVSALIHDGLHVDKDAATPAMLSLAAEFIREQTGYEVQLAYKPWEHLPEYLESSVANDTVQSGDFAIESLDGRLKRCNDRVLFRDDEHKWHCDQKHVQRLVTNAVSRMHIFDTDYRSLSRQHHTMQQISTYVYANAPDDPQFLTRMYHETLLKLPFTDGYYCFKEKVFVPEQVDCMARVPYAFPKRDDAIIAQIQQRVLRPMFNGDEALQRAVLCYIARKMAGHVEEKLYAVCIGMRDSGKGMLVTLLENCYGSELVCTVNGESFLHSRSDDENMKLGQLGMFDCEWARLAVSNEIKIEPGVGQAVDGTLLKKFASGGDTIKARVMRANAVALKIQAGLMMMVNDFPEVKPSDALETCVSFSFPCKFLKAGDPRIGTGCYKEADVSLKKWCSQPEVAAQMVHVILDSYGNLELSSEMQKHQQEFCSSTGDEESKFWELFEPTGSPTDRVTSRTVSQAVKRASIAATSHAFNRWLRAAGCETNVRVNIGGKTTSCVTGLREHNAESEGLMLEAANVGEKRKRDMPMEME